MKAVKIVSAGKAEIQDVSQPELKGDRVLVKVDAVALNPTDWKHIDYLATPGSTVGCDFSGTVVEAGPECAKGFKAGDRIAGVTHGANASDLNSGCFAEYAVVREGAAYKIPDSLSFEEAATTGVGIITVSLALYQKLGLPFPGEGKSDEWVLIYGGSTATGSLAIQYAKLSGCKVITTCSPRNFEFVKSLGADLVIDYNDSEPGKKINEATNDKLRLAFDCVSEGSSPEISSTAISSQGGKVVYLLQTKHSRQDVENMMVLAYTALGESFHKFGMDFPANTADYEFSKKSFSVAQGLLAEKKLTVHPVKVGSPGLEGVFDGLKTMREGGVSGFKLVHKL